MPELPEVETVRRGLAQSIIGKSFSSIDVRRSDLRVPVPGDLVSAIKGCRVEDIVRRGKYIVIFPEGAPAIILHLGMSGRVDILKGNSSGSKYKAQKHDHVIFTMNDKTKVVFSDPRRFGMLYLVSADGWENKKPFSAMGPEPLEPGFDGAVLEENLRGKKCNIKSALLDQNVVAGVGNIYACEALFVSGIHPERQAASVKGREAGLLADAIRSVLKKAIAAGGSSLKDYRKTDGSLGYFQHSFSVYDKESRKCAGCTCKDKCVQRIVQAGRSTFFCPVKQKKKAS